MIKINHLTYSYPNQAQPALRDVSLAVEAGEFLLLTGPSGAGKSTFLRAMNGLVPHFSGGKIAGNISVNGHDILRSSPSQIAQQVGFVFQNPESQTVLEQVEAEIVFGLENLAVAPAEMKQRLEKILALLDLTQFRQRALHTLSGGERQRAAIASSLILRPKVLLLDEPTSQLDPQAAQEVLAAIKDIQQKLGLTIVLAEHRLDRVFPFVDRVVVVDAGIITVDAPPREAATQLPTTPPLIRIARKLNWQPIPLTLAEANLFITNFDSSGRTEGLRLATSPDRATLKLGETLLTVKEVTHRYQPNAGISNISFTINAGEPVALLGHNGAGKSTLLRTITGLLPLQAGQIEWRGQDMAAWSVGERCRHFAYLPQNPDDLLFADTVQEELQITLRNHGMLGGDKPQRHGDTEFFSKETSVPLRLSGESFPMALLQELGLADYAGNYPRDLSVGQRQRVAFAAVAVTKPKLLLLDEPTRGLDMPAKENLMRLCRQWLDQGAGLLLVTHDVELIAGIAQRVLILDEGKLAADGEPHKVLPQFPHFAPQITRLFPESGWLTPEEALAGL